MLTEPDTSQKKMATEEQMAMKGKQQAHYEVEARVLLMLNTFYSVPLFSSAMHVLVFESGASFCTEHWA